MTMNVAWLSHGKLYLHASGATQLVESAFGREVVNRTLQRHQRNEWKTRNEDSPFAGRMLWGMKGEEPGAIQVRISSVTRGTKPGELLYSLITDSVGGLFLYDVTAREEKRLFHRESIRINDLQRDRNQESALCSLEAPNGTANLAVVVGHRLHEVTEGDSVDEAPCWIPGRENELVFQSAGTARSDAGYAVGVAPYAIERLNVASGTMSSILADPRYDFLLPRMTQDGTLYVIRRPYEAPGKRSVSLKTAVTDTIMFPFRLFRAFFHYLNFFSLVYSKKPLTAAGGPKMEGPDQKTMILRGKVIDAEKALREGGGEDASLVPSSWVLLRKNPAGEETVMAEGVAAFDVDDSGNIVYSNGRSIYAIDVSGKKRIAKADGIVETLVLFEL